MESEVLIFFFDHFGIVGIIFAFIFLVVARTPHPWNAAVTLYKWFMYKKRGKDFSKKILFTKLDYWLNFKIANLKMADPGREKIFKDLMYIRFNTSKKYIEMLDVVIENDMDGHQMFHELLELSSDFKTEFNKTANEYGIPKLVIDKFVTWRVIPVEFLIKAMEMICTTGGYTNNDSRLQAVYSILTATLELSIAEAEKTLVNLNGELTGVEYKGIICGDIPH